MAIRENVPDVRALRQRLGLSQVQLAQRLGVTLTTIARWEEGASRPARHLLRRLRDLAARADGIVGVAAMPAAYVAADAPVTLDFRGDPEIVRLIAEAERLSHGHLFSPTFATETSRIDPLPHQRLAVYEHMLTQPRLRFLLADDAGAGKRQSWTRFSSLVSGLGLHHSHS